MVNAVDASAILSEYAALSSGKRGRFDAEQRTAADVDCNGTVDAVDASRVLKFYAYLSSGGKIADIKDWLKK
jgi:hypothetical protein